MTCVAIALGASFSSACSPSPTQRARSLDARDGTNVYSWLVAHQPSAVLVSGTNVADIRALDGTARIVAAPSDLRPTCRAAKAAHALLFVIYPIDSSARAATMSSALDCGYTIARDDGGIVVAPR